MKPKNRKHIGHRMKLHLRVRTLGKKVFRIISLRPDTQVRFSTNFYHGTHHILCAPVGAKLLAHIMWGLSYQKKPDTFFLIHGEHLQSNPFDAAPSKPIILAPGNLTYLKKAHFVALRKELKRLGPSDKTIRWQSHGLVRKFEEAPEDEHLGTNYYSGWTRGVRSECEKSSYEDLHKQEYVVARHGVLYYAAPPELLRIHASYLYHGFDFSSVHPNYPYEYMYLAESKVGGSNWYPPGEIQVFPSYEQRCSAAREVRREILGERTSLSEDEILDIQVGTEKRFVLRLQQRIKNSKSKVIDGMS